MNNAALANEPPRSNEIGNLPTSWEAIELGEALTLAQYGLSVRGQKSGSYPILRMNCQERGRVIFRDLQFVDLDDRTLESYRLNDGDILFNRTNSYELVGRSALFDGSRTAVFASYLIRLVTDQSKVLPAFLNFYLASEPAQESLKSFATRGVSQSNISASRLRLLQVPRPPIEEQRAIAGVLSELQAAVELQDRIVAALRELKAATMAKLFREGLGGEPLKQTEIGEIPESWEVISLGDHCRITSGGTPSRQHPEYWGGPVPWVKTSEINYRPIKETEEYITESGLVNSAARLLPPGTLLMAMYGQGVTRGRVAFLEVKAATNQACAALHPDDDLDPGFLYAYLSFAYERIRELGHGANQLNLSGQIIRKIRIPLPPTVEEQRALHAVVGAMDSALGVEERRRKIRSQVFQSMLGALVTGGVRMPGSHQYR